MFGKLNCFQLVDKMHFGLMFGNLKAISYYCISSL